MKTFAGVLCGLVVSISGQMTAAQEPVERLAYDDCYLDSPWSDNPQFGCHIIVANPDASSAVSVADGIDPSWSPDGSKIAFSGGPLRDDVVVLDLSDGVLTNLTNHPAADTAPAWSPDGSKIAFESNRTGSTQVFVMNADGSGVTQLTQEVGFAGRPTWSPDGARLAFHCEVVTGNVDICSIAADGTDLVRLTDDPAGDFGPAWSPDGTHIAFTTMRYGLFETTAVMNADGSAVAPFGGGIEGVWPAWSLDGTRLALAFHAGACPADGTLCYDSISAVNADGTDLHFVAGGSSPSWTRRTDTARPFARFHSTCTALTCTFDGSPSWDLGSTITAYAWDFGDGAADAGAAVSHTFADPGAHTVTLTVTDAAGVTGTQSQTVEVALNVPPVASFTETCSGLICYFDPTASSDADGWVAGFSFDFGDGTTYGAQGHGLYAFVHYYPAPGNYTVTLTITDSLGATGTRSQIVTAVNSPPVAASTSTCSGRTCGFNASSSFDPDGTIAGYAWAFGDGTTGAGVSPSHSYATAGNFTVTLTVTDNLGATGAKSQTVTAVNTPPVASFTSACSSLTCSLNASSSSDPDGTITSYAWTFGDGVTGTGATLLHAYPSDGNFTITLTVTDNLGATGTRSQAVTVVNTPPVASFTEICDALNCFFNASASRDPDGGIIGFAWTFGDGATGTGIALSHAYTVGGSFTVTLTVTDNGGATATNSQVATVVFNAPPVASFTATCNGRTCAFDGSASSDPDSVIAGYAWAFGDGATGEGRSLSHVYTAGGSFTVTLTVRDIHNATGTKSETVTAVSPPPIASFTSACSGLTCSFDASASSDADGTVTSYAWTFGDGAAGTGVSLSHAYTAGGNFTVTLTVTDNLGATGTKSQTVTAVNAPPVASFTSTCSGLTCSFDASASSDADGTITSYTWAFGDGATGSGASVPHAYATAGTYTVTLTVTDNGGATGTQSKTVTPTQAHVGDLDGSGSSQGGTWKATVTITVHNSSHGPVAGATVTGSWSVGGTASCTSDSSGRCAVARSAIPGGTRSTTFTVTGLTHATMTYKPAANHDPDGDSNGTTIVVRRP